jgi:XTP/dITP diphosphohydrolase
MIKLLIATTNSNKVREIKEILVNFPYPIISLSDIKQVKQAEETGETIAANARIKGEYWAEKLPYMVLAEDSGLEVDALGGRPGVYSSRYGKSDKERINKLIKEMKDVDDDLRTARFRTVIVICLKNKKGDIETHEFEGISEGKITKKPLGENGFGYDPIFYNLDLKKTNAQATLSEKNQKSHRGRALKKAMKYLFSSIKDPENKFRMTK